MLKIILRRGWIVLLFAAIILLLPNSILRTWLPRPGTLPTPTSIPTADPLDESYAQAIALAAKDPLAALPMLNDAAFSSSQNADEARQLAAAIQAARLADDQSYLFTATGQTLAALGEWQFARIAFLRAVELAPDYAEAWAYLSEAQQQNGEDGLPALKRAQDLNPLSLGVQLFSALYWQRQGDFAKADTHYRIAALLAPADPSIRMQWGQNSVLAGDVLAARQHFERAVELAPGDLGMLRALAEYSLDAEVLVDEIGLPAAQSLQGALPNQPFVLTLLGRAYALLDQPELARTFLERSLSLDPNYAPGHLHLALFLLGLGENDLARFHLDQVIALAPGSPEAEIAARWIGLTSQ